MTFDYKKNSLDHLKDWLYDCMGNDAVSPKEIFDTIKEVIQEQYYYYKNGASKTYELLTLINGQVVFNIDSNNNDSIDIGSDLNYNVDPGGNDLTGLDFWEENHYPDEYKTYKEAVSAGYEMTADGFWIKKNEEHNMPPWGHSDMEAMCDNASKQDKVVKWRLPVEEVKDSDTDETEYFITFPDDLLEATNLLPGDEVEWIEKEVGTFLLRKITKPLGVDEC
jgi:hypothetical protein